MTMKEKIEAAGFAVTDEVEIQKKISGLIKNVSSEDAISMLNGVFDRTPRIYLVFNTFRYGVSLREVTMDPAVADAYREKGGFRVVETYDGFDDEVILYEE